MNLFRSSLVGLFCVLPAVSGCGGGNSSSSSQAPVVNSVQATVTPAGGTVHASSGDATFKLTIPSGALREDVTLTLTSASAENGAWARLQVEPAGIQFFVPVTITITLPQARSGAIAGIYLGSAGNRFSVPTTVDPATGTLIATILTLGSSLAPIPGAPLLRAAGANAESGGADFINVGEMNCANELQVLAARIAYANNFQFTANPGVYELIQQYKAMQLACANPSTSEAQQLNQEIAEIKEKACTARNNTLDSINLLLDWTEDGLYERVTRLIGGQAALDLTDAECGPPGATEGGLAEAANDYIDAYEQRLNSPNFGGGTWLGLRGEVKSIIRLHDDAAMLLLENHKQIVIDSLLKPGLEKLRARAYQLCREDNLAEGNQSYLADVRSGGQVFGTPMPFLAFDLFGKTLVPVGLAQDIQYCASDLTVQAYAGTDPLEDQVLELGGGDTAGTQVTKGTIEVPVQEGVISLQGIIRPLHCATPTTALAYENSTLVIKFNNTTVDELTHANGDFLPNTPVDLDVSDLYTAAGLDPNTPGTYVLKLVRQGTGCAGVYGEATVDLFEITVISAPPPIVRLTHREHSMSVETFFEAIPAEPGLNQEVFYDQYEGPVDSLATYSAILDPPEKIVTRDNSGSFDGRARHLDASFTADGNGNVISISGSADFDAETNLSGCLSLPGGVCGPSVLSGRTIAYVKGAINFEVQGGPVSYNLAGALTIFTNDKTPAQGLFQLKQSDGGPVLEYRVCSSADLGSDCATLGSPTTPLASSPPHVLQPGLYTLSYDLTGEGSIGGSSNFGGALARQANGSINFTLTFAPAP